MKMVLLRYVGVLIVACGILSQVGCAGSYGVFYKPINGISETQTYKDKEQK